MGVENDKSKNSAAIWAFWGAIIAALITGTVALIVAGKFPPFITTAPTSTNPPLQSILLRAHCGNEYIVNANEPILIYYGGWGVKGMDLANQWTTALDVSISIDGAQISGEQHSPAEELPFNCTQNKDDMYWLYYTTILSKLPLEYMK